MKIKLNEICRESDIVLFEIVILSSTLDEITKGVVLKHSVFMDRYNCLFTTYDVWLNVDIPETTDPREAYSVLRKIKGRRTFTPKELDDKRKVESGHDVRRNVMTWINKELRKDPVSIENKGVVLYNDNCLNVFPLILNGSIDCIICDPPYKVISGGAPTKKGQPSGMLLKNDGKIFDHNELREDDWFPIIFDKLKKGGHCYIMSNTKNLERYLRLARESGFKLHNLLIWEKNTCTPNRWYMKNAEYVLFLRKGKARAINNKGSKTIHSFNNPRNKTHPTEKPVDLFEFYIQNSTKEGDTVLDFAMGCGSTGIACIKANRRFVGIEIDMKYYDISLDRMMVEE
jgi:site-specific DNA-methyltransferase (adenine-specific)